MLKSQHQLFIKNPALAQFIFVRTKLGRKDLDGRGGCRRTFGEYCELFNKACAVSYHVR